MIGQIDQDKDATLDYSLNYEEWLEGDVITASGWTVEGTAPITVETHTFSPTLTTVWLKGGTPGTSAKLLNRITTALGRIDEYALLVKIIDR